MADVFLTLKQLENLYWQLTMQILGYDPADYENPKKSTPVRIAWPADGSPAWKRDEDVIFLRIGEDDDPFNKLRDTTFTQSNEDYATQATSYTRVLNVHWVCYGPNSYDNAFRIRNALYDTKQKEFLGVNKIYLIPAIESPRRSPELFVGQWWERTNLMAKFNELIKLDTPAPYLKSATVEVTDQHANTDLLTINKP